MLTDHPIDLLPGFALGCLEEDEHRQVRRHLRGCGQCLEVLAAYQEVVGDLAVGAPAHEPPKHLKQRLMTRIGARTGPAPWFAKLAVAWPRLFPAGALAALILVAALVVSNVFVWRQLQHRQMERFAPMRLVWLQATPEAPGASGTLIVGTDASRALLVVNALKPLDPAFQYQLWLIKDGRRTNGGVFSVKTNGQARMTVVAPHPMEEFDAFGITIEPFGGSPGPTGRKVLGGKMRI